MKRTSLLLGTALTAAVAGGVVADSNDRFRLRLQGVQEVPAVITSATGEFRARIFGNDAIDYTVSYSGLQGDITQSHIHIGQRGVNGGIVLWLCQTAGTQAPAAVAAITPQCQGPRAGEVSGTLGAANIIPQVAQGIAAGELADVIRAIQLGFAYVNVHTVTSPGGELRSQFDDGKGHRHHH